MSEEKTGAGKVLGIIGLIFGVIALPISFIDCLGFGSIAVVPGIIGVLLSLIGVIMAMKNNGAKVITIIALIVSLVATGVAYWQYTKIVALAEDLNPTVEYDTCEELLADYEATITEMGQEVGSDLESAAESEDLSDAMGALGGAMKYVAKIGKIQEKVVEMECMNDEAFITKYNELNQKYSEMNQ